MFRRKVIGKIRRSLSFCRILHILQTFLPYKFLRNILLNLKKFRTNKIQHFLIPQCEIVENFFMEHMSAFCLFWNMLKKRNISNICKKLKVIFCKYLSIPVWIPSSFENWRPLANTSSPSKKYTKNIIYIIVYRRDS